MRAADNNLPNQFLVSESTNISLLKPPFKQQDKQIILLSFLCDNVFAQKCSEESFIDIPPLLKCCNDVVSYVQTIAFHRNDPSTTFLDCASLRASMYCIRNILTRCSALSKIVFVPNVLNTVSLCTGKWLGMVDEAEDAEDLAWEVDFKDLAYFISSLSQASSKQSCDTLIVIVLNVSVIYLFYY